MGTTDGRMPKQTPNGSPIATFVNFRMLHPTEAWELCRVGLRCTVANRLTANCCSACKASRHVKTYYCTVAAAWASRDVTWWSWCHTPIMPCLENAMVELQRNNDQHTADGPSKSMVARLSRFQAAPGEKPGRPEAMQLWRQHFNAEHCATFLCNSEQCICRYERTVQNIWTVPDFDICLYMLMMLTYDLCLQCGRFQVVPYRGQKVQISSVGSLVIDFAVDFLISILSNYLCRIVVERDCSSSFCGNIRQGSCVQHAVGPVWSAIIRLPTSQRSPSPIDTTGDWTTRHDLVHSCSTPLCIQDILKDSRIIWATDKNIVSPIQSCLALPLLTLVAVCVKPSLRRTTLYR